MTKAQIRKNAFLKSIPIMCSYISERNCGSQKC